MAVRSSRGKGKESRVCPRFLTRKQNAKASSPSSSEVRSVSSASCSASIVGSRAVGPGAGSRELEALSRGGHAAGVFRIFLGRPEWRTAAWHPQLRTRDNRQQTSSHPWHPWLWTSPRATAAGQQRAGSGRLGVRRQASGVRRQASGVRRRVRPPALAAVAARSLSPPAPSLSLFLALVRALSVSFSLWA